MVPTAMITEAIETAAKAKQLAEAKDSWGVGSILYSSWGYEQTNIEFYKVIKRTKSTVTIVRLSEDIVEHNPQYMSGYTSAGEEVVGEPIKSKRITSRGGYESIKLSDYKRAYPWDGTRKYFSYYG